MFNSRAAIKSKAKENSERETEWTNFSFILNENTQFF